MREQQLIWILLKHQSELLTVAFLAKQIGCSRSLVYKMIQQLNKENNGYLIRQVGTSGYYLDIQDHDKFDRYRQALEQNRSAAYADPLYRIYLILNYLLTTDNYLTIEMLITRIPVSKSTILKDLTEAEKILQDDYGLTLLRRKHYGLKIEGPEGTTAVPTPGMSSIPSSMSWRSRTARPCTLIRASWPTH